MSYASDCKLELMKVKRSSEENKALILGMLLAGGKIDNDTLVFSSTALKIINYFSFLLERTYKIKTEVKENTIQSAQFLSLYGIKLNNSIDYFLIDKDTILAKQNMAASFLCGAFLARGSVNDPNTFKYHFEVSFERTSDIIFAQQVINEYNFNAKISKKRNRFLLYLKDAEKIVDILRFIGVTKLAFSFEEIRIDRDMNNSINRVINCEVANEQKTISSAREQLRYIKYLEYNYPLEKLDPKILTIMKIRKDNPEASLVELIDILKNDYGQEISKPGLAHRFAKIKQIATEHSKNKIK